MTEKEEPTVNIVVSSDGVKVVQFWGDSWQDAEKAQGIYQRIKSLIEQIDLLLKEETSEIIQ